MSQIELCELWIKEVKLSNTDSSHPFYINYCLFCITVTGVRGQKTPWTDHQAINGWGFFGDQEALCYCFTTAPAGITIPALVDTSFPFLSPRLH